MHLDDGTLMIDESTGVNGRLRLTLSGCLDIVTAPQLEARLRELDDGTRRVELDLARLTFIDLQGLRVIHSRLVGARGSAADLLEVRPGVSACVKRLVELTGVELWSGALPSAAPVQATLAERGAAIRISASSKLHLARRQRTIARR